MPPSRVNVIPVKRRTLFNRKTPNRIIAHAVR